MSSVRGLLSLICLASLLNAQDLPFTVQKPKAPAVLRPYLPQIVPPVRLYNSNRLSTLMRAGKLYLTVQDAIALAVENNLGLEINRYGPLLAQSALERAQAGGPLRGVPSASAQVSSVNAGVGVNGSTQSAGLGGGGGGGNGGSSGNAAIQQVGAITPNLDPVLQSTTTQAHLTQPQANTVLSQTNALVQKVRTTNSVVQMGLLTGGTVQFRNYEQRLSENSPSDSLNPAVGPHMDIALRQNLLQGFGVRLNDRNIRISMINVTASRESFRSQLLDVVAGVVSQYWDVVTANDEMKARQQSQQNAEKFFEDTKKEIAAGALPRVELPRAQAEVATRRQDLTIALANLRQREYALKESLVRVLDPAVEAAEIVPLDRIQIPDTDDLPPLRQLVSTAMAKRPDVLVSAFRDQTSEIALLGTENPLLPNLQVTAQSFNRGVAGTPQASSGGQANPYFSGGYGTALGQIFRRNFPNYSAGASFSIPIGNRTAQGDYGIDQLQYRQSQVSSQRDINNIVVDISARMSAVRQARSRHTAAVNTRALQEQLLAADRTKFASGIATFNDIINDQRALVTAQISEVNALSSYARARVSLDQTLGETLERNGVSLEEGLKGKVNRESRAPDVVAGKK
ncbi:MAG: outer rane efflux protein [Candidatus Solibacter sp.]|jgi:outer membrane protein|nr:outer rane efflux protein [Candidatus Solibacter sp.]